jgi:hypothetical protein
MALSMPVSVRIGCRNREFGEEAFPFRVAPTPGDAADRLLLHPLSGEGMTVADFRACTGLYRAQRPGGNGMGGRLAVQAATSRGASIERGYSKVSSPRSRLLRS